MCRENLNEWLKVEIVELGSCFEGIFLGPTLSSLFHLLMSHWGLYWVFNVEKQEMCKIEAIWLDLESRFDFIEWQYPEVRVSLTSLSIPTFSSSSRCQLAPIHICHDHMAIPFVPPQIALCNLDHLVVRDIFFLSLNELIGSFGIKQKFGQLY